VAGVVLTDLPVRATVHSPIDASACHADRERRCGTLNRLKPAIGLIQAGLDTLSPEQLETIDAGMDLFPHSVDMLLQIQSEFHAGGLISDDEGDLIQSCLRSWNSSPMAMRIVVAEAISALSGRRPNHG